MPKTKVFIAWSGDRSKDVAQALRQWLPKVIQNLDPWMSEDIDKGKSWRLEISTQLEKAQVGIICLTPENREAPWINFEAGAISKQLDAAYVCPYLLNLAPTELHRPLADFQVTQAEREDTLKLVQTINKAMGEDALPQETLNSTFDVWWKQLDSQLGQIKKRPHAPARPKRSPEDMLEEIVATVREEGKHRLAILDSLHLILSAINERLSPKGPSAADLLCRLRDVGFNPPELFTPKLEKAPEVKRNLRSEGLDPETK